MLFQIIFVATILSSCVYAACFGHRAGRYAAAIILLSAAITIFTGNQRGWMTTSFAILALDFLCFLALGTLAARFRTRWIIGVAGLQLAKLATHLATLVSPSFPPALYQALVETWIILIVATMAAGQWLERQKRS
jgi:hypothetical protein